MPFKKKEPVVDLHVERANRVKKLRQELDEKLDVIYTELGESYGFEKNDVIKIHRKLIYKYV